MSDNKFNKKEFVFFGDQNIHCQIIDVFPDSGFQREGFKYRYLVKFSNSGNKSVKWEWELHN